MKGSAEGNNGIKSIEGFAGGKDIKRIQFGIGRP
jgi:peptidyl-tRNA hydrolase